MPYPSMIHFGDFGDPVPVVMRPKKRQVLERLIYETEKQANYLAQRWVTVEKLGIRSVRTGTWCRASFKRPHKDISSASSRRLSFAPIAEELEVHWTVTGQQFIQQMKLELYSNIADGGGRLLWTRTLTWAIGNCPANGYVVINGDLTNAPVIAAAEGPGVLLGSVCAPAGGLAAEYPENCLTAEFTPYKLKLTIEDPAGDLTVKVPARWLYLDVRVAKLQLEWAPMNVLAASPVLGTTPVQRDVDVYTKLCVAGDPANLGNALPAPGQTKRVYLLSNDFYTAPGQLISNAGHDAHLATWGAGPNIPLFAKVLIRQSDGVATAAPRAVGRARFLWEWADKGQQDLPPWTGVYAFPHELVATAHGMYAHDQEYVACALDYNPPAAPVPADYPNGKNCHECRGGKRGPNTPHRIFPVQAGYPPQAPLLANQFPFMVAAGVNRTWAGFSEPWGHGDVAAAGKSGAIFSPSRMAGDAYALQVRLFYPAVVNLDQVGPGFTAALATLPAEYQVSTGTFEIWREVQVSRYLRKQGTVRAAITQAELDDAFRAGFVQIRLPPPQPTTAAIWDAALAGAVAGLEPFIRAAIDPAVAQHAAGPDGVYFRNHAGFCVEINALAGGPAAVAGFLAGWAVPLDPYTNAALFSPAMYANNELFESNLGIRINWPRRILVESLVPVPVTDGINWLDVAQLCNPGMGPKGFGVPFRAPMPHAAALVLCGDSSATTAAHEIGHLLFLNHVDPAGDPNNLHAQHNASCTMSYNQVPRRFCGSCLLRLRGWSLYEVTNFVTGTYGAVRTLMQAAAANHIP